MASKSIVMPSFAWLIWGLLLGLALPYLSLLFHFAFMLSDWTPFNFSARTGIWVSRALPLMLIALFLFFQVRSALRRSTTSKPLTGLLVFLSGIGCISLGIFLAIKLGLLPGAPSYV